MPITSTMLYLTPLDCMDFLMLALLLADIPSFHSMNFFLSQNKTERHNELISFSLAQERKDISLQNPVHSHLMSMLSLSKATAVPYRKDILMLCGHKVEDKAPGRPFKA